MGEKRFGTLLAAGLVILSSAALTGCSGGLLGGGQASADTSGPIKLGMVIPTSGSSAAIGPYMKNGAQMAIDEINAKGGVLNGRKLELVVEDEACDPQQSVAAANKAVSQGVKISVGGYCSGSTLPTIPVFENAGIPMIIPAANSQELVKQKKKNVFLINGTGQQQSEAAVKFSEKQQYKSVALVHDNTSYSKDIAIATEKALKDGGKVNPVLLTSVTPGESDFSAAVRQIIDSKAELLYWTGYYQEGGLLINQLKQAGFKGAVMVADGSVDAALAKIAGGTAAEGVFATMTQTPDTIKGAETWIADYKSKFNAEPGPYSTQSYDAVRVAAEAFTKAGNTETDSLISALEGIDGFQLFSGPLKFTPEHTLSSGGFAILEVKNGKFVLKDPLT